MPPADGSGGSAGGGFDITDLVTRPDEIAALPTGPDDPRLLGWYHTIELGDGLVSRGFFDHRTVLDRYELPASLDGMTVLDAGSFDGFFAFEMERRGAARVVAIDIPRWLELDHVPAMRSRTADHDHTEHFWIAHTMLGSSVEHHGCNIYDLSPERFGTFDLVFCGDVLLHLQNPVKALANLRSVTRDVAVITTVVDREIEAAHPEKPWVQFGAMDIEPSPGEFTTYWRVSARALRDMLIYAGFEEVDISDPFAVPPHAGLVRRVAHAYASRGGAAASDLGARHLRRARAELEAARADVGRLTAELAQSRADLEAVVRSRRYRLGERIAGASAPARQVLRRLSGNGR